MFFLLAVVVLQGCIPKDPVILKNVVNPTLIRSEGSNFLLRADAILFNPNKGRIRLKEIQIKIFVNDKETALINQKLNTVIQPNSEFSVPLEVQLALKEIGIVDTLLGMLGGKSINVNYKGFVRARVNGVPVKVPVDHTTAVKLRF